VESLWTIHDSQRTDPAGVLRHYQQSAEFLQTRDHVRRDLPNSLRSEDSWVDAIDAVITSKVPLVAARAHLWLNRSDEATATLNRHFRPDDEFDNVSYVGTLATVALREGRLREASTIARKALDEADRQHRGSAPATLEARATLGSALFEHDELDAAERQYSYGFQLCEEFAQAAWASAFEAELVRTVLARGRAYEALDRLGRLHEGEVDHPLSPYLAERLNEAEFSCRLALGDLKGAALTLESIVPEHRTVHMMARFDLCAGRPDRAAARLRRVPDQPRSIRNGIERLALLASAHLQLGDRHRAEDALRQAIDRGRTERYIRVFLNDAATLLTLLGGIAGRFPDLYVTDLLTHAEGSGGFVPAHLSQQALEPLTDRERELLGYLPTHLSQHEIGGAMYISLNTVKTHLKGIYRKLGAASRSEAVSLAREHHLL
jgi:LuxR family maltose regulon positive regulatory protein